jgi:hypothetical protein
MNIEELNKLIQEELAAYLNENEEEVEVDETPEGDDDIEVTTDEPAEEDDALDTLRQIYDMLKPIVEPEDEPELDLGDDEGEEEPEEEPADEDSEEEEVEENMDRGNYKASDVSDVTFNPEKLKGGLNESFDAADRFKKLANIK